MTLQKENRRSSEGRVDLGICPNSDKWLKKMIIKEDDEKEDGFDQQISINNK